MKIFISYSRRDAGDIARQIDDSLHEDHDIFTDVDDIHLGAVWTKTIENNITNSDLFLVIITPSALKSKEVEKEVLQAQKGNKRIIPCIHRVVRQYDIKWSLNQIQGIEFDDKYDLTRKLNSKLMEEGDILKLRGKDHSSVHQSRSRISPLKIIIPSVIGAVLVIGIILAYPVLSGGSIPSVNEQSNNPPLALDDSVTTNVNQPVNIQLRASDEDINTLVTASIVSEPSNGVLSNINQATGIVTYTPKNGFTGADSFTFKVNDGALDSSNVGKVSLTVNENKK